MRARNELVVRRRRAGVGAHQHNAFLRHDERRGRTFQVFHGLLQNALELIGTIAAGRARPYGVRQQ
jgi:hypothetical protein